MHESALTEVDAHMRGFLAFLIEEQQVTFHELIRGNLQADFFQRLRVARKRNTDLLKTIVDEPTAIEAGPIGAAVAIRGAEHRQCMVSGARDFDAIDVRCDVGGRGARGQAGTRRG